MLQREARPAGARPIVVLTVAVFGLWHAVACHQSTVAAGRDAADDGAPLDAAPQGPAGRGVPAPSGADAGRREPGAQTEEAGAQPESETGAAQGGSGGNEDAQQPPDPSVGDAGRPEAGVRLGSDAAAGQVGAAGNGDSGVCGAAETCEDAITGEGEEVPNFNSGGSGIVRVTAGPTYTCVLKNDGRLICWGLADGNGGFGRAEMPSGPFRQASGGHFGLCGLRDDGRIMCWGTNIREGSPSSGSYVELSASTYYACALDSDSSVACWGIHRYMRRAGWMEASAPEFPAGAYSKVSVGPNGACALKSDGTAICLRETSFPPPSEMITLYGTISINEMTPPPGAFADISAGNRNQSCAIREDGSLVCWQYCDTEAEVVATPPGSYTQVSAGGSHNCALRTDGGVICWGDNSYQTDEPDPCGERYGLAIVPGGPYTQVSAGLRHACALKDNGSVACWGANGYEQVTIPSGPYLQVSRPCAIRGDGTIACWYQGRGWPEEYDYFMRDVPAGSYTQISAGWSHACALAEDGALSCWGVSRDENGSEIPPVSPPGFYTQVSVGDPQACAITDEGALACWNHNNSTIRDNDGNPIIQAPPPEGSSYEQVSMARFAACALASDGTIECWGPDVVEPWNQPPSGHYEQVSVGILACALDDAGSITCWAHSASGEMEVPVGSYTQVAASNMRAASWTPDVCALDTGGNITCWSNSENGLAEAPAGSFVRLDPDSAACAIDTEGSIICWGRGAMFLPASL